MNQSRLPLLGFLLACTLSIILLPGATAEELLFPDVLDPSVKPLYLSLSGPSTFRDTALVEATVLRQGCASVFVRSVDGDIRLEGAEVSKPAPGRPLENGGINYTGEWQGRRVAMDDVLQLQYTPQGRWDMLFFYALDENDLLLDVYCVAAEQADDGSYVLFPLGQ